MSKNELYNAHNSSQPKKKAFTLAEVLLTIVIIGVIAAITIYSLVQQHNKVVIETRLEQTYSILTNMMRLAQADQGDIGSVDFSDSVTPNLAGSSIQEYFVNKYMLPYLTHKNYAVESVKELGYKNGIKYPNGSVWASPTSKLPGISLPNGAYIIVGAGGTNVNGYTEFIYVKFYIDIDGPTKGPNVFGKDIFVFVQTFMVPLPLCVSGEFIPSVYLYTTGTDVNNNPEAKQYLMWVNTSTHEITYNSNPSQSREEALTHCKAGNSGAEECGALIKNNGWTIPKDYPWL